MEASAQRRLDGERAKRIVGAMRASVVRRGAEGSTFDHVAREAGVSRGLLHYYFGTKERLLVEVVRMDCEERFLRLDERFADARTADDVVAVLLAALQDFLDPEAGLDVLVHEMFGVARRNEEVRVELAELYRGLRERWADALGAKQREGVLALRAEPAAVASVLFAMCDGVVIQLLADPAWDSAPTFAAGVRAARFLLGADDA